MIYLSIFFSRASLPSPPPRCRYMTFSVKDMWTASRFSILSRLEVSADDEVWYPLGRHVGSTTYPGLQLTSYGIHSALAALGRPLALNDICVYDRVLFPTAGTAGNADERGAMPTGETADRAVRALQAERAHARRAREGGAEEEGARHEGRP